MDKIKTGKQGLNIHRGFEQLKQKKGLKCV
jgi:hypothetical protein